MVRPHTFSSQTRHSSRLIQCSLVLAIGLLFVLVQASPTALCTEEEVKAYGGVINRDQKEEQGGQARQLEQGKPIERELIGGQSHSYQISLRGDQYVKLVVDQLSIDVGVSLFGLDGKPITEVNSETRTGGSETISWVAEEAGTYRVDIQAKNKNAAAGRYKIQVVELGVATESDRALSEALKLNSQFLRLFRAGKYDEARPLGERVLQIREKTLGADHLDVAQLVNDLGRLYYFMAEYARSEEYYQRALTIREKVLGADHPEVAGSLNNIALLYTDIGKYDNAELFYQRALNLLAKSRGAEHPDVAVTITNFAKLYMLIGDYDKAEPLFQRARAIFEKALGPEHPNVTVVLNNLATLYRRRGNFAKAEPIYVGILDIRQKQLGPEHPSLAPPLLNLANFYFYDRGDYEKAEPLYQRAMAIREKTLGREHPDVARVLDNLAVLYKEKEDYAKAEMLHQRALAIKEKVLGPAHIDVVLALNDLAKLYSEGKRDYARAEPLLQRALVIAERSVGPQHPGVAEVLNSYANLYRERGEYAKAEPLYRRALTIRENSLGQEHPQFAESLVDLARLNAAKGDYVQAVAILSRANAIDESNFALQLTIGSERQILKYLSKFSEQTVFTLSLHSRAAPNDAGALDLAFTTLLQRKARGLDAMTDTIATLRRRATPEVRALFEQLTRSRSQLASLKLTETGMGKLDTYRTRVNQLEKEIEKVEVALSLSSDAFRDQKQPVTLSAVQAALPPGSALLEFVYFTPQVLPPEKSMAPRYLAYLLASQGQPKWVDLGEARLVDRAIEAWRKALRNPNRNDVVRRARVLDERLMRPVRSLLSKMPGVTRHLLIAPDGSLNLIPFAALIDERNRYLIERYAISYLTSGRDLLRLQTSEESKNAPLVVANPDFGRLASMATRGDLDSVKSQSGNPAQNQIDATRVFFQPLPGTEDEALAIKSLLPNATIFRRKEATESALKQVIGPRILHIATHGFFIDYQDPAGISSPAGGAGAALAQAKSRTVQFEANLRMSKLAARVKDPLLRSGLALAGVNEGKSGDGDDGLLTALEAASLNLSGTKLVVLSACDTGVGEVKNGEGVQGLRRALVLAGSESQVMSLWPVSDEATKDLMTQYYQVLQQGEGRGEGLRQVQLRMLRGRKDQRHPFYWAAFIQSGEWGSIK
jgi:CHAT domain-containing protein/Tfp pilus assembly protein PilF